MTTPTVSNAQKWSTCYHQEMAAEIRHRIESGGVYIFGAGANGSRIASICAKNKITIYGFIDETGTKNHWENLPVYKPDRLPEPLVTVIVSIFNPKVGFLDICARWKWDRETAISIHEFAAAYPEDFLPFYFIGDAEHYAQEQYHYPWLFSKLQDEESKRILKQHLDLKLHFKFSLTPVEMKIDPPPAEWGPFIFVDVGAYDGDTLSPFLEQYGNQVIEVIAIEPDPSNFERLLDRIQSYPEVVKKKVTALNMAISDKEGLGTFHPSGNQGARLSEDGSQLIRTTTLDALLSTKTQPCLVKIDVEGAENLALQGGQTRLKQGKIALAISLYHKPKDLIDIIKKLDAYCTSSSFYLKSCGKDGADLMLIAHHP